MVFMDWGQILDPLELFLASFFGKFFWYELLHRCYPDSSPISRYYMVFKNTARSPPPLHALQLLRLGADLDFYPTTP